jgi:hypothetical protein
MDFIDIDRRILPPQSILDSTGRMRYPAPTSAASILHGAGTPDQMFVEPLIDGLID